jgi:hypothetical protein
MLTLQSIESLRTKEGFEYLLVPLLYLTVQYVFSKYCFINYPFVVNFT